MVPQFHTRLVRPKMGGDHWAETYIGLPGTETTEMMVAGKVVKRTFPRNVLISNILSGRGAAGRRNILLQVSCRIYGPWF